MGKELGRVEVGGGGRSGEGEGDCSCSEVLLRRARITWRKKRPRKEKKNVWR